MHTSCGKLNKLYSFVILFVIGLWHYYGTVYPNQKMYYVYKCTMYIH